MQFGLTSLLIYVSAFAVILGLNMPAESLVRDGYVMPCINVGFQDLPSGYEDRIPGPATERGHNGSAKRGNRGLAPSG